ncbi:MAG: AMP-binding protein [Candidatus Competibacteraceae bacterium]|nr:AMP-binding protein [Candidatus Competibacteraceae bacterium]
MLTHRNLIYNMEATIETFPHDENTTLVGFLPFFHSFGHMATLWMVLCLGLRGIYHPNPLEPKIIGGLIEKYKGTIMIGTSTFLQSFIRRCTAEQMKSLSFVVCGAEKLSPRVRDAFSEKFGVEPLEGYGTTECAPAVSVNVPDQVSPGFYARGTERGTIGRLLPGQASKVFDPDTGVELGIGQPGLLCIKGPNIMKGYLNQPEKTAKVLKDGWYETGDIAALNIEGFITITDRLARFSKIAGEMVPHTKVEEVLHQLLNLTDQAMAIASVPDQQKGERLVVLHTLSDEELATLVGRLDQSGLPNLWVPRPNAFYRVDAIPVLGTGKMDIKSVKKLALALDLGE